MNGKTSSSPPPDHSKTRNSRKLATDLPESFPFLLPPVESDEIGRLGNYRVLRLLGAGGMGMVFKAEDIALRRLVALKVMKPEEERKGAHSWRRFLREAQAMAAIKHDHLVTIYQVGEEGETIYIAMELLEGESLDQWIDSATGEEMAEIARIGREIAVGLAAIHKSGLVHRDLKPSNLWLEAPDGRVKILDFGLARRSEGDAQLTETGILVGTPAFLSPEQARGKSADFRSDLFSLGCVLYRMCTKELPFRGENTLDQLAALAADRPTPVADRNPQVPEELADLVMELLAKEPQDRPESAQEVAERLQQIRRSLTRRRKAPARSRKRLTGRTEVIDSLERTPWWRTTAAKVGLGVCAALIVAAIVIVVAFDRRENAVNGGVGQKEFLSDMPKVATVNWPFHKTKKGKGPKGPPKEISGPVSVNGQLAPHGIFMHAAPGHETPASISYRLGKQFRTFSCRVSVNDSSPGSPSPLTFAVFGDGVQLWKSQGVTTQEHTQECSIQVAGVDMLKLEVTAAGEAKGGHAVWLEPAVSGRALHRTPTCVNINAGILDGSRRIMATFLNPELADDMGLVGMGGDLEPRRLLHAYRHGIFPWYDEGYPVCWWSPDPRAIFELDGLHVSRRLRRTIRSGKFQVTVNRDFAGVIRGCTEREEGTWIIPDMIDAYETLHRLGHAHSVEVWRDGRLAGGLYGVAVGGLFAGESMFCRERDASKVALAFTVARLRRRGFQLFDIQMITEHTARLGAIEVPRTEYLARLREAMKVATQFP